MKNLFSKNKDDVQKQEATDVSTTAVDEQVQESKDVNEKKLSKISKLSTIWTVISTIYAIATACTLLAKNWVEGDLAYVLIISLVVYIVIFIVLVFFYKSNPKKLKTSIKTYKSLLGVFKGFASIVFLVLSAVSMAGLATGGTMALKEWAVFIATLGVAVVKLGFKIYMIVFKAIRKSIGKKFKVKVVRYVDGKEQKQSFADAVNEKSYK